MNFLMPTIITIVTAGSIGLGIWLGRQSVENPNGKIGKAGAWIDKHWWKAGIICLWLLLLTLFN